MPRWNNPNCGFQKGHKVRSPKWTHFKKGNPIRPPYPPKVKKVCRICKKIYFVIPSDANQSKCCSRKCLYKYHRPQRFITEEILRKKGLKLSGKNHWNWQGGITPLAIKRTNKRKWKRLRKEIFKRDNYKCRICGISRKRLNAHHIKPWIKIKKDKPENLISVCCRCHGLLERGKIKWFQSVS